MVVRALCSSLMLNAFLLVVQDQKCYCATRAGAASPLLVPDRLQFFEYESIQLKCEGLDSSSEWRVMRKLKENTTNPTKWETSAGSTTIYPAYASTTGEYWCENKEGERGKSVNITVTDGDVILESPSVPVMEGDSVSLNCRSKIQDQNPSADFFKDGNLTKIEYEGTLTIDSVSKSDEGVYKCSISGAGESPDSWLAVRASGIKETPPTNGSPYSSILLSVALTILSLAGLLLVVGTLHCWKKKVGCFSSGTSTPGEDLVSGEARDAEANTPTYAVVTKNRKKRDADPGFSSCSVDRTLTAGYNPSFTNPEVVYSTIP